jgi:xylan 1,4-beta-xylosidase
MSYWTYSDLFEEPGPPTAPFQGGFGLMNPEGVRKPAWFAYKYLHALKGREVPTGDGETFAAWDGREAAAVIWDWEQPVQKVSNHPFYTKVQTSTPAAAARVRFTHLKPGAWRLEVHRVGFRANDAYTAYLEMGSPKSLTPEQLAHLQALTRDAPETVRDVRVGPDGRAAVDLPMRSNDVALVTLAPLPPAR